MEFSIDQGVQKLELTIAEAKQNRDVTIPIGIGTDIDIGIDSSTDINSDSSIAIGISKNTSISSNIGVE